jgi:dihydrofolate reductase
MRKLIVTQFMSLDGVLEAPEKWSFPYWNDSIAEFKHKELFSVDALLLGRVTYEGFAAAWPGRKDNTGYADRINSLPKYVVSTTLTNVDWENSKIIKANLAHEISEIKNQKGGDILIFGSPKLVQSLIQLNLVDEYQLLVYPLILGNGKRLFSDLNKSNLKLVGTKTHDSGVVLLSYQSTRIE